MGGIASRSPREDAAGSAAPTPREWTSGRPEPPDGVLAAGRYTRRRFLSLALASCVCGACGLGRGDAPPAPTARRTRAGPAPEPTVDRRVALGFDGRGGEVWAWEKRVTGRCLGCASCRSLSVQGGAWPAALDPEGDRFGADVRLRPGKNPLVALCAHRDGRRYGSTTMVYEQKLPDRPRAVIALALEDGRIAMSATGSTPSEGSRAPITRYEWSARETNPAPLTLDGAAEQRATTPVPAEDGEYYVSLRVTDSARAEDTAEAYVVVEAGRPRLPDLDTENAAWVERAVVYGVISRTFGDEGLRSVTARLDDLKDLGADALWLAPVNATATDGFGYEVTDYFSLRPDDGGGTDADFRALVRGAHSRGMRVLMDFVPSHTSVEHPYFRDAQAHGPASPYYDLYQRDEAGNYTWYFDYDHLATLDYENPDVRRWIMEAFSYWVREFDVDGFRVDFAWAIQERRPDFWPEWRRELKRIKPDLLLIAEASARDPAWFTQGFDAAYDWTDELGHWAWDGIFDSDVGLTQNLHGALTNFGEGFHPDALILRFLNNNDTGDRFITRHGEGMTRAAAALLLTLPGLPCVYTGDEVGAEFQPYDESCCLTWEDPHNLRPHYKRLIALRHELPGLRSRSWMPLEVGGAPTVYAYARYVEADAGKGSLSHVAIVALNFSEEAAEVRLRLPEALRKETRGGLADRLSGEDLDGPEGATLRFPLGPWQARIVTPS